MERPHAGDCAVAVLQAIGHHRADRFSPGEFAEHGSAHRCAAGRPAAATGHGQVRCAGWWFLAGGIEPGALNDRRLVGKGGINRASLQAFIATLEIPEAEKQRLLQLSPDTYTGKAAELAKRI